jgi:flavin reductase (DIM6/NTAB) family NADH-FMN oxidoreductase RutF
VSVERLFREAMAGLVAGIAVVTARRDDERPCGLVATSVSSFSADPPSVLVSIGHTSRCHSALIECEHFGVDKFAGLDWRWDGDVPVLGGTLAYLRCRRGALFELYDHSILVGDLTGGERSDGQPLVYMDRRMDWRLAPP